MNKSLEFITMIEEFKKGSKIKLVSDVESDSEVTIPADTVVKVTSFETKGGKKIIGIESIDGETATLVYKSGEKIDHILVKL